jgi:hypothetical protein
MFAIEFKAKIKNGMIPIPKQYLGKLQPSLKVIVLQEEPVATTKIIGKNDDFFDRVAKHRFHLPEDYCFKREDLHDRV